MGTYVDKLPQEPFSGEFVSGFSGTGSDTTKDLVTAKFNATMADAQTMLTKLLGVDGNSGYLGNLNAIIQDFQAPTVGDFAVTVPTITVPSVTKPTPSLSGLDLDFPTFDKLAPSLSALPTVDLSAIIPAAMPEEITAAINWIEEAHGTELFDVLMTRLLADLAAGATGLSATVEAEIIARAQARQDVIDDKLEQETLEFFATRGFTLPTGAMQAQIAELANERARNRSDLNGKTMIEQAELAQKNSQFVIQTAKDLEAILRDFTSKKNDRSLDFAKAVAANAIAIYAEGVKAYVAAMEANRAYVEVQVENLKAVVESNKGLVASFQAESDAYKTIIEAKAKKNEAITGVFDSEVKAYDAETRAVATAANVTIEEYRLRIQNADMQLRKAIAEVEAAIQAFGTESSLREKVAEAMANIAMQSVASAYGAVNASAGLTHATGRHESESFTHSESRQADYNLSNSLSEGHQYEHDPAA